MTDFKKALIDPDKIYDTPQDVAEDNTLNLEQKIKILKQWSYDAHELMVAEEENMISPENKGSMLNRVLEVLHKLEKEMDSKR